MKFSFSDGKDSDDVNSLQLSSENDVENDSKNVSFVRGISMNTECITVFEQKDEIGTSKSPDESKCRQGQKRLSMNLSTGKLLSVSSSAETPTRRVVKEESPTPLNISISKTTKGKPRKRTALIKLKRGKARKKYEFLWSSDFFCQTFWN